MKIHFFSPVPKSPICTGLISVKNLLSNISCLGPFKATFCYILKKKLRLDLSEGTYKLLNTVLII